MADKPRTFYEQELERIAKQRLSQEHLYLQIRQSTAFMERYYSEKLDLDKMAATASMSRFHFIRSFRRVYGVTPRAHLRDLRIKKAKELLKAGLSVTQVCFDVGYESLPSFSATFKRGTGHSPKKYQQLNNRNPR
jgi:AraC-like DNA-binding protein